MMKDSRVQLLIVLLLALAVATWLSGLPQAMLRLWVSDIYYGG